MTYDDDLRLAHVLADNVERTTMELFRSEGLQVDRKADRTLVTRADVACEEQLRHQLKRTRPRDAVQGEEMPTTGHGSRRWVLDPIDGTANYVRGVPVWATLIALVADEEPVLGLVAAPALNRRWWAATGSGAWTGRNLTSAKRIHVSDTAVLEHASVSYASLTGWPHAQQRTAFLELCDDVWRTRAYGDFWSHMLVADGSVDVGVDPALEIHDMAALAPIVTEAGGRFTSLEGKDGPWGGNALTTNGLLHDEVLRRLQH